MELKKCFISALSNVEMIIAYDLSLAMSKVQGTTSVYSHWQKKLRQLEGNYDRLKLAC